MRLRILVLALPFWCSGCAALFHGSTQTIAISTDPAGAQCTVWRSGQKVAAVSAPGTVTVDKMDRVLTLICSKPTYDDASLQLLPHGDSAAVADLLLAPLALLVDGVSGAWHFYQSQVTLSLTPQSRPHRVMAVPQHF